MPITRKQFELGIDNTVEQWMKTIHAFLVEHKEEAFTMEELRLHLLGKEPKITSTGGFRELDEYRSKAQGFDEAVEKLVELLAAYEKQVRAMSYYSIGGRPLQL